MAISEVASRRASGQLTSYTNTLAVAFPGDVSAGHLLIVMGSVYANPQPPIDISDTLGTTYSSTTYWISASAAPFTLFIACGVASVSGPCTVTVTSMSDPAGTTLSFSIDAFLSTLFWADVVPGGGIFSDIEDVRALSALQIQTAEELVLGLMRHTGLVPGSITAVQGTLIGVGEDVNWATHGAAFQLGTVAGAAYTVEFAMPSAAWAMMMAAVRSNATGPPNTVRVDPQRSLKRQRE